MTETSTYDVVLLVEQALSDLDAQQIRGLHQDVPDHVRYHLLLPVEDAAARVESAMGALATGDALVAPPMMLDQEDVAEIQRELLDDARSAVTQSVGRLSEPGPMPAVRASPPNPSTPWPPRCRRSAQPR